MIARIGFACMLICLTAIGAHAIDDPFKTAISVNGINISNFDLEQRRKFLRAINAGGDIATLAEEALISEQLYIQEADRLGLEVTDADIQDGITEYAARSNLSGDKFLRQLAARGVAEGHFIGFIRAGTAWRKVIAALHRSDAGQIGIDDVERSVAFHQPQQTRLLVRLSEIALSLHPGAEERSREIAFQIHQTIHSAAEFADTARSLSIAGSKEDSGNIGWVPIDNLPPEVREAVSSVPAGQTTRPVETQGVVFVFFKHELREETHGQPQVSVEYAILRIADNDSGAALDQARRIMARSDTCSDFRAAGRAFPRGSYRVNSIRTGDEGNAYSEELEKLDRGEFSIIPIAGSKAVELLMLCDRRVKIHGDRRSAVLNQSRSQRLEEYSRVLLGDLRASAIISRSE
ncbi:MAG: peptidylprolyl isomerase [Rhodobacteraceae bacterium]|nr:peptidylprolyl isomerase [Paracoccaceae bacterium]